MILITKIDNYKKINKDILTLIEKIKNSNQHIDNNISNTDVFLPKNYKRDYLDYFYKIIEPYMYKISLKLFSKDWVIHNGWFQQYCKSDYHNLLTHAGANFANVYFVELPDKSLATEIYKNKNLNLKEGDLLTFPAYLYHRSPVNNSNKRKTIISFNSSFENFFKQS